MTTPTPLTHPSAWLTDDLATISPLSCLNQAQANDLTRNLTRLTSLPLTQITADDFDLGQCAPLVEHTREELLHGRGIAILRGFPVADLSPDDLEKLFWGLGTHFGHVVSQSRMGDRLGHVLDASKHPGERGYRSSRELSLHTDSDDIVMMLCIRQAKMGGINRFTSATAIYNEIAQTRPALLAPLVRGFRYHWRGEQPDGEPPITDYRIPVFAVVDGVLSCIYLREFIDMAAQDLGEPLTKQETEALEYFHRLANDERFVFNIRLQSGDVFLINNYCVLHSRTEFEDDPGANNRRHLLRLWLKTTPPRVLHPAMRRYYGADGIEPRQGEGTVYQSAEA